MSKRVADTYLTDRNFDDEEPAEEAGSFTVASKDVLSKREIRKARRKGFGNDEISSSTGAFKGFTGFTGFGSGSTGFSFGSGSLTGAGSTLPISIPVFTATSVPSCCSTVTNTTGRVGGIGFGFAPVSKLPADNATMPTDTSNTSRRSSGIGFGFAPVSKPPTDNGTVHTSTSESVEPKTSSNSPPVQYLQQLKSLNQCLVRWIDQHVQSNPYCILTPVFRDYDKHVDDLNRKFNISPDQLSSSSQAVVNTNGLPVAAMATSSTTMSSSTLSTAAYASPGFFSAGPPVTTAPTSSVFSFSASSMSSSVTTAPTTQPSSDFSFSASSSSVTATTTAAGSTFPTFGTNPSSGFTFGRVGSTFGGGAAQPSGDSENQSQFGSADTAEDEPYEPPKRESVETKEDDAFYQIRCKLFFMLNNEWKERGVGILYLKPCPGDKTQLLIRSDTTLGSILLNISLTKSIPTNLQGKTNVSLSCVPNPPVDSKEENKKPMCMLIRVKTADDANELLKQLNDNKK